MPKGANSHLDLVWRKNGTPQITPHTTGKINNSNSCPTSHLLNVSQNCEIKNQCDDDMNNSVEEKVEKSDFRKSLKGDIAMVK